MNDKYFLDTNIFVYSFDARSPEKQKKAQKLIDEALNTRYGCISTQVVQEFLNVATRKFKEPLSIQDSQHYLTTVLEPLCEIFTSIELYHRTLELAERWQYSFYDSLIIAAALKADCKILYTEDMQDGQMIQELKIVNPFV
ncbi:MAG: PIN domain-containing protein [bacterium]